ncbi:hypothetical protein B0I35DRAFT_408320 [Stachybotrys elegans]|uniref:PCI domain-containing protein n=1 Tax=Stachybotrys elegans TaxID=80388 RepID=A0A8K0SWC3_9HYPO|nr:hypothetical protein B0I35DRAFT_408320 [Stachybotrys elegans]
MEQDKALNALEPFLALSKSATSPRAAADLVTRATSAPNTYVFAELLQTPPVQALAEAPEYLPYLTLLQIFSYGTYQTYLQTPNLPALSDAQAAKLRQLSLLSLASDRSNLTYQALQKSLDVTSTRQVEDLVISAIYAGLLHATLDPARQTVEVTSIAPLRDLTPGSIPTMVSALQNWEKRCTSTLGDIETQIQSIRAAAAARESEKRAAEEKFRARKAEFGDDKRADTVMLDTLTRRSHSKRAMGAASSLLSESMDVDEPHGMDETKKRTGKRKM